MNILIINLVLSTFVFCVAARLYVVPNLPRLPPQTVLLPILLLHSLRHLGLMFLAPGAVYPGIPGEFAYPAARVNAISPGPVTTPIFGRLGLPAEVLEQTRQSIVSQAAHEALRPA